MNLKSSGLKKIKNFCTRTKKDRKVKPIIKKNISEYNYNFEKNDKSSIILFFNPDFIWQPMILILSLILI